jgi:cell division transport system permease protein
MTDERTTVFDNPSHATRRARQGILREWRLFALSIFSLTVAFVCLGAALLVMTNLRAIETRWTHAGRVSVFLKESATDAEIEKTKVALEATAGVSHVIYVTSEAARDEYSKNEGNSNDPLLALPKEAFSPTLEVDVDPNLDDKGIEDMEAKLGQLQAVESVETYRTWTNRLARLVRGGVAASGLLSLVVFASVLAVVGSTIRLALQRRKTEIEVLKLVGATDAYIKRPFLLEGSAQGAAGATGAVLLLGVLFLLVRGRMDGELTTLLGVEPTFLPWFAVVGMVVTGALLGTIAASLGLRKLVAV